MLSVHYLCLHFFGVCLVFYVMKPFFGVCLVFYVSIVGVGVLSVTQSSIITTGSFVFTVNRAAIVNWYINYINKNRMMSMDQKNELTAAANDLLVKTARGNLNRDPIQAAFASYKAVGKKLKEKKKVKIMSPKGR